MPICFLIFRENHTQFSSWAIKVFSHFMCHCKLLYHPENRNSKGKERRKQTNSDSSSDEEVSSLPTISGKKIYFMWYVL